MASASARRAADAGAGRGPRDPAMKHILVVDDEPRIADICRDYLERAGFEVETAGNGVDALAIARTTRPDLVVLDLGLPRMDGLDVTRALRKESNVPIIMLTARVDESDKLIGLELGADDYLTKPFSPKELVARVRAVFRRIDPAPGRGDLIRAGGVTLDVPRMHARVADRVVELTTTEFELLATLMRQPGRVFTRGQLLDAIRGERVESFDRAIDAHVKNLRRKLEADPRQPRFVLTVYGVGYRFADT
jgi:two-component system alkaline phosphatase synthesis response regulator PhoP